ncbi:MAG: ABC transporter permease [Candidatus Omnitrophica bacterium]|nr:ABC transporter permease [Candidatus Omnitrophota bacterium]
MKSYGWKRLLGLVPLFLGITILSFAVIHLAPGGPSDAKAAFNPKMTAQARDRLREIYGLDRPLLVQYADWVRRLARLDFGRSFVDGRDVREKIAEAIPVTLLINALSLGLIFLVGIPLGVAGAVHEGRPLDRVITAGTLAAFSMPAFWLALLLISVFGVHLRALPVSGVHSLAYEEMTWAEKWVDVARHLLLPVLVSSLTGLAGISRFARGSMLDALRQNYIRTARAKGIPERRVLYRHALGNALLPIITLMGLSVPGLLGGSVIFETIFSIPGMGRLFFNSVFTRDYPVIMGVLVLGAFLTLLGNLLADLGTAAADPRTKTGLLS